MPVSSYPCPILKDFDCGNFSKLDFRFYTEIPIGSIIL